MTVRMRYDIKTGPRLVQPVLMSYITDATSKNKLVSHITVSMGNTSLPWFNLLLHYSSKKYSRPPPK